MIFLTAKVEADFDNSENKNWEADVPHWNWIEGQNVKVFCYTNCEEVELSIDGPGEIIGIENGDPSDLEPYSAPSRKVHHGRQLVYVRSTAYNEYRYWKVGHCKM